MVSVGFVLSHEQFPVHDLIEYGVAAEKAGFDMLWASDHFHPWMHNQGHSGQAWITLAALGQRTQRIPFGTGVTCPTYRYHPAIVAQSFASLGVLYPGRVFLGVGSGEAVNEEAATGEWGDYEERSERMVEAVKLIRQLWAGKWVSHQGKYYRTKEAHLYDLPAQPIPIYIAAGGEESMELAGKHGDGLISGADALTQDKLIKAFATGARIAGKEAAQMPKIGEAFICTEGKDRALELADLWRFLPRAWKNMVDIHDPRTILELSREQVELEEAIEGWIIGENPQTHIDRIQELADAGVTHVFVHSAQPDQRSVIDFYANQVLPEIQHQRMEPTPVL